MRGTERGSAAQCAVLCGTVRYWNNTLWNGAWVRGALYGTGTASVVLSAVPSAVTWGSVLRGVTWGSFPRVVTWGSY
eukprot:1912361-Rhodomonas_salina.1